MPKTIGNKKRDCAWGCARRINTTSENLQIEKHKSGGRSFRSPDWFVLFDLQIFWGGVYPPSATSRTISFSISNSFWYINLIHFFDEKKDGAAGNSIVCFGASIPCHAIWQRQNEEHELFRRAQRFWQQKVWTQRPSREEKLRCPETLFISHENANFSFSVFRVVQGGAKTPKIMGCCRAILHFYMPKDWHFSWKMNIRTSVQNVTFRLPGFLFFLINSKLAFSLIVSQRWYLAGTAKKTLDLERRTMQKRTFCLYDWKPI